MYRLISNNTGVNIERGNSFEVLLCKFTELLFQNIKVFIPNRHFVLTPTYRVESIQFPPS